MTGVDSVWDVNGTGIYYNVGKVGIGITNPIGKLHVRNDAGSTVFRTDYNNTVIFDVTASSGGKGIIGTQSNHDVAFEAYASEKMRITVDGKVGIGISNPARQLTLFNASNAVFQMTTALAGTGADRGLVINSMGFDANIYNGEAGYMGFGTSNIERMRITSDGKVGINTSNPNYMIDVVGTARFGTNYDASSGKVVFSTLQYGGAAYFTNDLGTTQGAVRIYATYNLGGTSGNPNFCIDRSVNSQPFGSDPTTLTYTNSLTIDGSNGHVGIGITNPTALLHISGFGAAPEYASLFVNAGNNPGLPSNTACAIRGQIRQEGAYTNIGVIGYAEVNNSGYNSYGGYFTASYGSSRNKAIGIYAGGADYAAILNGRVGIGTSTPSCALHIVSTESTQIESTDGSAYLRFYTSSIGGFPATSSTITARYQLNLCADYHSDIIFATYWSGSSNEERMRIRGDNGCVGIGLNPSRTLHIGSATPVIKLEDFNSGSNEVQEIIFATANGEYAKIDAITNGNATGGLFFYTASTTNTPTERLRILFDGRIGTRGEDAPDVRPGGLCLNMDSGSTSTYTRILSFKDPQVNHGMTSLEESDTFAIFSQRNHQGGGLSITGLGENTYAALDLYGYTNGEETTTNSGAQGAVTIFVAKRSGTATTAYSSNANMFVIMNRGTTSHIFKGNGDIYTDTGYLGSYDKEEDLILAETVRHIFDGKEVLAKYKNRLEALGILQNGFMSHQKMMSLNLGAVGQLFNIICGLAKKLGLSKNELLEMAGQYT